MSMRTEFKEFVMRGNVVDLAVGVVIGGAFGRIVTSLVDDIIMPALSPILGGVNFTDLKIVMKPGDPTNEIAEVAIRYGNFIQTFINFLIIAFAIFLVVKGINKMKRKEEEAPAAPPEPTKTELLLEDIKNILEKK